MQATQLPPAIPGGLPLVGHALHFLREPLTVLERGAREHGDMFSLRLGPQQAVVLLGPDHHDFFFAETDRRLSIQTAYPYFVKMFDQQFYFFGGQEEYQRQRSIVAPRLQGQQVSQYVDVMVAETRDFMKGMGDRGELELLSTLGPLVMRIAAHSFLGKDFSRRLGNEFFEEFRRFSAGMDPIMPPWLPLPHLIRSQRSKARLHKVLGSLLEERRRKPLDPPDFLQTLAESRYPDGSAVPDVVKVNLILLLVWAGHETTTGHISWALIDLLQHPAYLGSVLAEQDAVLTDRERLPMEELRRLKRMDWALKESERLHPVAFSLVRVALEDLEYRGYRIPRDTMIMLSPWMAHRMAEVYSGPESYKPERFDGEGSAEGRSRALIGFGGGVHRCLGVHFAYLEMKVILTMLLSEYELELLDRDPQPKRGATTKWPESPCRVRYRRRVF